MMTTNEMLLKLQKIEGPESQRCRTMINDWRGLKDFFLKKPIPKNARLQDLVDATKRMWTYEVRYFAFVKELPGIKNEKMKELFMDIIINQFEMMEQDLAFGSDERFFRAAFFQRYSYFSPNVLNELKQVSACKLQAMLTHFGRFGLDVSA